MFIRSALIAFAITLAACSTDPGPGPSPDAHNAASPDAAKASNNPDASAANACTGAAYDPCTDPSQCMSGNCHLYQASGFEVCTVACSAANPCPMQNGVAVTCNNMGICKPPQANSCTR